MGIDTSVRSTHILLRETSHDCCLGNWIYQKKRCCLPQWSWQRWRGELSEVWSGTLHQDEISWIFPPCGSICGSEIVPGQWRAIPGASLWHAGDALYKLLVWLLYLHTVCRVPWFQLTFHHFFFGGVQFYKLSGAFFFLKSNLCDLWTFPISCFLDQFRSLILLSCDKFFLSACHFQRRWGTRNSLLVLEQPTGLVRDSRPTRPCPESFSILHIRVALYPVFQKHIWKKTKKTKTKLGCTLTEFYRNCKAESRWLIVSKKKVC